MRHRYYKHFYYYRQRCVLYSPKGLTTIRSNSRIRLVVRDMILKKCLSDSNLLWTEVALVWTHSRLWTLRWASVRGTGDGKGTSRSCSFQDILCWVVLLHTSLALLLIAYPCYCLLLLRKYILGRVMSQLSSHWLIVQQGTIYTGGGHLGASRERWDQILNLLLLCLFVLYLNTNNILLTKGRFSLTSSSFGPEDVFTHFI